MIFNYILTERESRKLHFFQFLHTLFNLSKKLLFAFANLTIANSEIVNNVLQVVVLQ